MTMVHVTIGSNVHIYQPASFAIGDALVVSVANCNGRREPARLEFIDRKSAAEIAAALTAYVNAAPKGAK
jgi:hypothetical protein